MAYQVLARKWRPKNFADLVGQEHVVKALRNALDKGRLHHAYLLTGTRGVGKTTIARILAKSLNCENANHGEPCGVCQSCTQIDAGRYVDLLEIDAASNTGIDNIREVLENAQYAPTAGKYKVYIIDEVHMLSKSAFNAMLKTLEEPPEHVKFILATTDPHKVPITVLSRCLQFVLRNMTAQQVADHLAHVLTVEQIPFEPPALQLLGRAAMGSMRDALSLLDQAIAMGSGSVAENDVRQMIGAVDKRYLEELLGAIAAQDGEAMLAKAQEMAARAVGFDNALAELAVLLHKLALAQTVPSAVANDAERDTLLRLAPLLSGEQIQLYYQCALRGKQDLPAAPDEYTGFVMTLLRMLAFAPMAAKAQPLQGKIAGTQWRDAEDVPAKKPQTEPSAAAVKQPEQADDGVQMQAAVQAVREPVSLVRKTERLHAADVPPWEDLPSAAGEQVPDKVSSNKGSHTAEPSWAVSASETPAEQNGGMPSADGTVVLLSGDSADRLQETAEDGGAEPVGEECTKSFGDDVSDGDDGGEAYPAALFVDGETAGGSREEPADFTPLPPFGQATWFDIVERLSARLGGAQMLAQDCAWVSFDAAENLLMLSLGNHSGITVKKEFFDKIRDTLADAYELPQLKLQTCTWQDGSAWETPAMRRKRRLKEGLLEAQQALESDETCRKLMEVFGSEVWKRGSIEFLEAAD
ncbi:MAG: DNA polymerase III subunit gamma/tau [Neisseria sp.]|nr:DNA polymerase III subunit gamma/tau [Neisseria sp.]